MLIKCLVRSKHFDCGKGTSQMIENQTDIPSIARKQLSQVGLCKRCKFLPTDRQEHVIFLYRK